MTMPPARETLVSFTRVVSVPLSGKTSPWSVVAVAAEVPEVQVVFAREAGADVRGEPAAGWRRFPTRSRTASKLAIRAKYHASGSTIVFRLGGRARLQVPGSAVQGVMRSMKL